jgi:hypothetical protein
MEIPEKLIITLVFGSLFIICALLVWVFSQNARSKERRLLIEKGINPDDYAKSNGGGSVWLKLAYLSVGLGIGLGIIAILASMRLLGNATPIALLCICGGGALILENSLSKKRKA